MRIHFEVLNSCSRALVTFAESFIQPVIAQKRHICPEHMRKPETMSNSLRIVPAWYKSTINNDPLRRLVYTTENIIKEWTKPASLSTHKKYWLPHCLDELWVTFLEVVDYCRSFISNDLSFKLWRFFLSFYSSLFWKRIRLESPHWKFSISLLRYWE